ncbi:MAG: hypothetical protein AAB839_02095 [Patescibacteria group bacterium]
MRYPVASRLASLVLVAATVFGIAGTAFAAPGVPTNLSIVGGKYTNDTTPTFTWTQGAGATWYDVLIDNGSWTGIGNTTSFTAWPLSNGWHTFFIRSHDNGNGVSVSEYITFEIDTKGPSIPAVSPSTATTLHAVSFSVRPSGEAAVTGCWLYVNSNNQGGMSNNGGTFSRNHTFTSAGSYSVYARCADGDGNYNAGASRTVTVTGSRVVCYDYCNIPTTLSVAKGTLVKINCTTFPSTDNCNAIYYYGEDGRRHLFPSESVYKTWFNSYSTVQTISKSYLSSMPVGENVTYHPGTVLVKFSNSSTVYAVDEGGVLRPFATEAAAKAVYGSHWTNYIVLVPQSLYGDYTIGRKIYTSSDYSKTKAYNSVDSIDDNF